MPYYSNREHYDYLELKNTFSRFLKCIEGISELEIMGGETFLHPQIDDILKWLIDEKNTWDKGNN